MINNTVADNTITTTDSRNARGIYIYYGSATIKNTISYGHNGEDLKLGTSASAAVSYSDICDTDGVTPYSGQGNLCTDPLFVDPANNNYHLQTTSPVINMATPVGAPADDIDGDIRPQGAGFDIGADEYVPVQLFFSDLAVTSSDIGFSVLMPSPGDSVTITAQIYNKGEASAQNVFVDFYDGDTWIGQDSIPEILVGGAETATLTTSFAAAGIRIITVKADPDNAIPESDESNNEASQIYQVGDAPDTEADIILQNGTPSQIPQGVDSVVSGLALYRVKVGDVTDTSHVVKGGKVFVEIKDASGTIVFSDNTHYTDINGVYSIPFPAMGVEGDRFDLYVEVTDQSLTGILNTGFIIGPPLPDGCTTDCPELPPTASPVGRDSGGTIQPPVCDINCTAEPGIDLSIVSEDIVFSNEKPILGEEIRIDVTIRSSGVGKAENIPFRLRATYPTIGTIDIEAYWIIDRMDAGETVTLSFNWKNYAEGVYIIEASLGEGFYDTNNSNNAATREIQVGCNGTITGSGYYYTDSYRTQVSVNIDSNNLSAGTLNYYNSQKRISLASTSIDSVDFISPGVAVIKGKGTVNLIPGYTFTVKITDAIPDTWEITILAPVGLLYESGSGSLIRGDIAVVTSAGCGY